LEILSAGKAKPLTDNKAASRANTRSLSSLISNSSRELLIVNGANGAFTSAAHSRPRKYGTASLKIFSESSVRPPHVEVKIPKIFSTKPCRSEEHTSELQ